MPRLKFNSALADLRSRRDDLQIQLNLREHTHSHEDAFQVPGGPQDEANRLHAELAAVERAIKVHKSQTAR